MKKSSTNFNSTLLHLALLLFFSLSATARDITASASKIKPISRDTLKHYLSHSINLLALNDLCIPPDGYYEGRQVADRAYLTASHAASPPDRIMQQDILSSAMFRRYQDMLRLIKNTEALFIADAIATWGTFEMNFLFNRSYFVVRDIKRVNPHVVVQAAPNEYAPRGMVEGVGNIPAYVFRAFDLPIQERRFDLSQMGNIQKDGMGEYVIPDISRLESKMWFYYQGVEFINIGIESLNFSQVELMNGGSTDPLHWQEVFSRLRAHAANTPHCRFILITGHTVGMKDANDNLLMDFHTSPVRQSEFPGPITVNGGPTVIRGGAGLCDINGHPGSIYKVSRGGITPSGWACERLPSLVFLDNYNNGGNNSSSFGSRSDNGGECFTPYHMDEISWFALQSKEYRDDWLKYAWYQIKALDTNVYFSLPIKRVITVRGPGEEWWPAHYFANHAKADILPAVNTTNGQPDMSKVQLYASYDQEAVIKELLAGKYNISFCPPAVQAASLPTGATNFQVADFNGDKNKDIVSFTESATLLNYLNNSSVSPTVIPLPSFAAGEPGAWDSVDNPRLIGDVNGDGSSDMIAFGNQGTWLSFGSSSGLTPPVLILPDYNYCAKKCWTKNHPRHLADVNGDGKDDIVGFGDDGAYVSYSSGDSFSSATLAVDKFGYRSKTRWKPAKHKRAIADVNGDGMADIVGFHKDGVYLSLSTGSGFTPPSHVLSDFRYCRSGCWNNNRPRHLADVNGDGKADIVGFGSDGVYVSFSNGTSFAPPFLAIADYGYRTSTRWKPGSTTRYLQDLNDDGKADIVALNEENLYISLASGTTYNNIFLPPVTTSTTITQNNRQYKLRSLPVSSGGSEPKIFGVTDKGEILVVPIGLSKFIPCDSLLIR